MGFYFGTLYIILAESVPSTELVHNISVIITPGYNVATGQSIGGTQLLLASAPRRFGFDMSGMVVVYDINMEKPLYNFTGLQVGGTYFTGIIGWTNIFTLYLTTIVSLFAL